MGNMKLGKSMPYIHQKVPGFNDNIGLKVAKFFRQLKPEKPQFRSNWLLVPELGLDPMRYTLTTEAGVEREDNLPIDTNSSKPEELNLRVEYQCILRLKRTQHIVFSIRVYSDPLPAFARAPRAAAVLR